jgi:hypothetical protein
MIQSDCPEEREGDGDAGKANGLRNRRLKPSNESALLANFCVAFGTFVGI